MSSAGSAANYSRILQFSKVVGTVSKGTREQVYTAPASFRRRQDYGLKRGLPPQVSTKTPLFSLREIDTTYSQTDYRSAAAQTAFVRTWDETELGAVTARRRHQHADSPAKPIRLEASRFDAGSREAGFTQRRVVETEGAGTRERPMGPDVLDIDEPAFKRFVDSLRQPRTRQLFKQFLAEDEAKRRRSRELAYGQRPTEQHDQEMMDLANGRAGEAATSDVDLYSFAQKTTIAQRVVIEEFFEWLSDRTYSDPSSEQIHPSPHPNLGLAYAHPDGLHAERLTAPIPGRVLDAADKAELRQLVSVAGVVGRRSTTQALDLSVTPFDPDAQGHHNLNQGRHSFRVDPLETPPAVDPFQLPSACDFQGFNRREPNEPNRFRDPTKVPRAMDTGRVRIAVKEAGKADARRPNPYPIGSMDWVGQSGGRGAGSSEVAWLDVFAGKGKQGAADADLMAQAAGGDRRRGQRTAPFNRRTAAAARQAQDAQRDKVLVELMQSLTSRREEDGDD